MRRLLEEAGYSCQEVDEPELAVVRGALVKSGVRRVEQPSEPEDADTPKSAGSPDKSTGEPAPDWASDSGEDEYGRWAEFRLGSVMERLRWIEPGPFWMGSPEGESERDGDELLHKVTLTQGYWLGETACPQGLWEAVTGSNPSLFKGPERPVERVSWNEIKQFIDLLNDRLPGLNSRLPTEAQWEHAARAGSQTPFWWGSTLSPEQANYNGDYPYADGENGEYRKETVPVKSFEPNPWGLYQVHGNVREWCEDWFGACEAEPVENPQGPKSGERRVCRGGSWFSIGCWLRAACRDRCKPDFRDYDLGFRLCAGQHDAEHRGSRQP